MIVLVNSQDSGEVGVYQHITLKYAGSSQQVELIVTAVTSETENQKRNPNYQTLEVTGLK